jgi:hypothetical protein
MVVPHFCVVLVVLDRSLEQRQLPVVKRVNKSNNACPFLGLSIFFHLVFNLSQIHLTRWEPIQQHTVMPVTALVVFDSPDCGGAAAAFEKIARSTLATNAAATAAATQQQAPDASSSSAVPTTTPSAAPACDFHFVPVASGASHDDALLDALRRAAHVQPSDFFIVAFLKGADPAAAFRKIRAVARTTRPSIADVFVAPQLQAFQDPGLVVRNLSRRLVTKVEQQQHQLPQ